MGQLSPIVFAVPVVAVALLLILLSPSSRTNKLNQASMGGFLSIIILAIWFVFVRHPVLLGQQAMQANDLVQQASTPTPQTSVQVVAVAPTATTVRTESVVEAIPAPTSVPAPTATPVPPVVSEPEPTAARTPEPEPTKVVEAAPTATTVLDDVTIVQQAAKVEQQLSSGVVEASAQLGANTTSSVIVHFSLAGTQSPSAIQITTVYTSGVNVKESDYIQIADRSWHRNARDPWSSVALGSTVAHQLSAYLPRIPQGSDVKVQQVAGNQTEITWFDNLYGAEVQLWVDAKTHVPIHMRRVVRSTGVVLSVDYNDWNKPVNIVAPA